MVTAGTLGAILLFAASFAANGVVLAYRWARTPYVRTIVDGWARRLTGRGGWSWLKLWHILAAAAAVAAVNLVWSVPGNQCSLDSLALYASGSAALHGHDPFLVNACGFPNPDPIPYGGAAVLLDSLGALAGSVLGVWIVWQFIALGVILLVWNLGGTDRRYLSVLTLTSVLFLPNFATRIDGPENTVVGISVLLMLCSLRSTGWRGKAWGSLAAFLSTARFSAFPPTLAATLTPKGGSRSIAVLAVGVFVATAGVCYEIWGWVALKVVYLDQFTRVPAQSFNAFDLLLRQGWVHPSLALAAIQGGALVALMVVTTLRGYSPLGAACLVLVGVMLTTQYALLHFDAWLIPLVLLGPRVNRALLVYGGLWYLDANIAIGYLGATRGVWWPTELLGVVLAAILAYLVIRIILDEESMRQRSPFAGAGAGPEGGAVARR